jgi:hypothetical protein
MAFWKVGVYNPWSQTGIARDKYPGRVFLGTGQWTVPVKVASTHVRRRLVVFCRWYNLRVVIEKDPRI